MGAESDRGVKGGAGDEECAKEKVREEAAVVEKVANAKRTPSMQPVVDDVLKTLGSIKAITVIPAPSKNSSAEISASSPRSVEPTQPPQPPEPPLPAQPPQPTLPPLSAQRPQPALPRSSLSEMPAPPPPPPTPKEDPLLSECDELPNLDFNSEVRKKGLSLPLSSFSRFSVQ